MRAELSEQKKAVQATVAERDQVRAELAIEKVRAEAADQANQEQRQQAAAEAQRAAERLASTEADRDAARGDAGQAREEAARLAGQLSAHQEQTAAILARLAPAVQPKPTT